MKKLLLSVFAMLASFATLFAQTYTVDFETGSKSGYASANLELGTPAPILWNLTEALIGKDASDFKNGTASARLRGYTATKVEMQANKPGGIGNISFQYRAYGTDAQIEWKVEWSPDGTTWNQVALFTADGTVKTFSHDLNQATARIRIIANATNATNKRTNIDDIVLTDATGGQLTAAVATFTPGTGNYLVAQSVTLNSATEGAAIYYTTDGSDPDQTKSLFSSPIQISQTTTIKARAYKEGLNPSPITTAIYTFPTEVTDIATLRQNSSGLYKLTGEAVLTLKTSSRNAKYIQDATAGILIDDAAGVITTVYNPGDGITGVTGTLGVFNSMLQFTPVADPGAATSSGKTVNPVVVPLAEIINHPAKLVTVKNVTITGTGNFAASTNYNLNGAANPVLRVAYSDLPYVGQPIPATEQDITGVVLMFGTTAQLVPRTLADFNTSTGLAKLSADYKVYVSAGTLMVESPRAERMEVYNALGQLVHASLMQAGMNSVQVPAGLLIVKIGNQVAKVMN